MAAVAAQSDNAAELLQKLSLDYQPKNVEVQDHGKKFGSIGSNTMVNGYAKPYERATPTPPFLDIAAMSTYYAPQGYASPTSYYGGYDGSVNEWNDYRYMNWDLADYKNQGLPQQNLNSGVGQNTEYMGKMQVMSQIYSPYGNAYGVGSRYPSGYCPSSKTSWYYPCQPVGSRNVPKSHGNGLYRYGYQQNGYQQNGYQQNKGRFNELSKGPRSGGALKTPMATPVNSMPNSKEEIDVPCTPSMEQYNKEDFPENYTDAKFFIIKSYSEDDVHKSIKYGIWSSTPNGNKKLDAAYQEACGKPSGCPVFLLFSVNSSGQFVGLAEMVGSVDFHKTVNYWQQDKWIGCFPVKWHIVKDVPNSLLKHIRLQNNENKPVTNSRDTQEVHIEQGNEVLKIFKLHSSKTSILDDFQFYEQRESAMQDRKTKRLQYQKHVKDPAKEDAKDQPADSNGETKVAYNEATAEVERSANGSV